MPVLFRKLTLHPVPDGPDETGVSNTTLFVVDRTVGSKPPPSGSLPSVQLTDDDTTMLFATLTQSMLSCPTTS